MQPLIDANLKLGNTYDEVNYMVSSRHTISIAKTLVL